MESAAAMTSPQGEDVNAVDTMTIEAATPVGNNERPRRIAKKRKLAEVDDNDQDADNNHDADSDTMAIEAAAPVSNDGRPRRASRKRKLVELAVKLVCAFAASDSSKKTNMKGVRALYSLSTPDNLPSVNVLSKQYRTIKERFTGLKDYFDGTKSLEDLVKTVETADEEKRKQLEATKKELLNENLDLKKQIEELTKQLAETKDRVNGDEDNEKAGVEET
ncbi:hypothetical protein A1O1_02087 [Capronia coronata CBS 617.96]|uniref:Uncharacterized protein n=1 Tax=Capronia coronata CBS 617.96 TaxID=1182541 RepID=W9YVI1_9EURO|nr:uncharacterized protein A1O1_02087 [Capronia coronata CBS 617.96]EXJ93695.1 hypothetical protein A1O1_02087 [Capronia coronata CBS 617.96]